MPSNYIYGAMFYRNDPNYVIVASRSVFPKDTVYYDYDKINKE